MNRLHQQQKVLIVDDAPLNIQVLNETLRGAYRTFFATTGRDALKVAMTVVPDLILLDIMMPEMDGYEVCRILKADPYLKDVPVIFITAMSSKENESVGLELGAVDYITKPFNPGIVRLRVRNHLELKRQRDLLGRLSLTDGLTGIANRRAFDDYYGREWRRALRAGTELALVMLDIDHFKQYNDRYGHLAGDDCLKRVAVMLEATLARPGDFLARYGGEEFVCVLPETNEEGALVTAERLRGAVTALRIPHETSPVAPWVTVSLGVAAVGPTKRMKPEELLKQADDLLYCAKNEGRDRVAALEGALPAAS